MIRIIIHMSQIKRVDPQSSPRSCWQTHQDLSRITAEDPQSSPKSISSSSSSSKFCPHDKTAQKPAQAKVPAIRFVSKILVHKEMKEVYWLFVFFMNVLLMHPCYGYWGSVLIIISESKYQGLVCVCVRGRTSLLEKVWWRQTCWKRPARKYVNI